MFRDAVIGDYRLDPPELPRSRCESCGSRPGRCDCHILETDDERVTRDGAFHMRRYHDGGGPCDCAGRDKDGMSRCEG